MQGHGAEKMNTHDHPPAQQYAVQGLGDETDIRARHISEYTQVGRPRSPKICQHNPIMLVININPSACI